MFSWKPLRYFVFVAFAVVLSAAWAYSQGLPNVEFKQTGAMGPVTFSHQVHVSKGLQCNNCHPAIFPMKAGGEALKMADMNAGKECGACHNGKKAFPVTNCMKCHAAKK